MKVNQNLENMQCWEYSRQRGNRKIMGIGKRGTIGIIWNEDELEKLYGKYK